MSGFTIEVKITDAVVRQLLAEIQQRTGNLTPAMKIIGQIVRSSVVKNFESEGRPTPWKKSKRADKKGGRTLTRSGRLMKSITSKAGQSSVEIGTNLAYARIHQLGGSVNHPARERVIHFRRNTVDLFANPDDANRQLRMTNGKTLYFRKKAGAGFSRANKRAHYAMKISTDAYTITMPKREFLMVQPEDWREIESALVEHLLNKKS